MFFVQEIYYLFIIHLYVYIKLAHLFCRLFKLVGFYSLSTRTFALINDNEPFLSACAVYFFIALLFSCSKLHLWSYNIFLYIVFYIIPMSVGCIQNMIFFIPPWL